MEHVMNTLPDQDMMCAQMAVSFTLSNPPADEVSSLYNIMYILYCIDYTIVTIVQTILQNLQSIDIALNTRFKVFLGEFPMKLFTEKQPLAVLQSFTDEIQLIGEQIRER